MTNPWRDDFDVAKTRPEVELLVTRKSGSVNIILAKWIDNAETAHLCWRWARTDVDLPLLVDGGRDRKSASTIVAWREVDEANWMIPKAEPSIGMRVTVWIGKGPERRGPQHGRIANVYHADGMVEIDIDPSPLDALYGTWTLTTKWDQCTIRRDGDE